MQPVPSPDRALADVLQDLRYVVTQLMNLQPTGDHIQVAMAYTNWLAEAERMLRYQFVAGDLVWPGLNTERARQIAEHRLATRSLFDSEKAYQLDRLNNAIATMTKLHEQFAVDPDDVIAVLDTNYLLRGEPVQITEWSERVECTGSVHLVVPHIVIDELDGLTHQKATKQLARAALRSVDRLREDTERPEQRTEIGPGATLQILPDPPFHHRLPDNDSELMTRVTLLHSLSGKRPTIITFDRGMLVRAHTHGLRCLRLHQPSSDA